MSKITSAISVILVLLIFSCTESKNDLPSPQDTNFEGIAYGYLISQKKGKFDSLLKAIDRVPALKSFLQNSSNSLTFFVVENKSFEIAIDKMNEVRVSNGQSKLFISNIKGLETLLNRYVFNDKYLSNDIRISLDGTMMNSLDNNYRMHARYRQKEGDKNKTPIIYLEFSDTNSSVYNIEWDKSETSAVDKETKNGVVHILSTQHEFGFGKLIEFNK